MSVLSYWLTSKPFVLSLYKCDTTRMVGRPVNCTVIYTSLLQGHESILPQPSPLKCPPISPHSLNFINPPTHTYILHLINPLHITTQPAYISLIPYILYTYTAYISLIPYLYTYTAYISLIPHVYLYILLHLIYLYRLHFINPLYIPKHPTSHESHTCTYTAYISLI